MITPYEYHATFLSNYDGDTLRLEIDQGLDNRHRGTFRLFGVQCPEMKGETLERAKMIRDMVCDKLRGKQLEVRTIKDKKEKYGRYLAVVQVVGEEGTLNDWLIAQGYAERYMASGADAAPRAILKNKMSPYGYCPQCRAPGWQRERRPNGNDVCENGHSYPSSSAVMTPME